jgi:hypothetical protein
MEGLEANQQGKHRYLKIALFRELLSKYHGRVRGGNMPRTTAIVALLACSGAAVAFPPNVRAVRQGAPPGGNGLTWATAYNDLQAGLNAAAGSGGQIDELWVASGMYLPTQRIDPTDPTTVCFSLQQGVAIYGGFAGTETVLSQRNPAVNVTTLAANPPPISNVVHAQNVGSSAVLDGFRITDATPGVNQAAGILILTASPTIRNCTITGNGAGAVYIAGGSPGFHNCAFTNNSMVVGRSAIRIIFGSPFFESGTVSGNTVNLTSGAGVVGAGAIFHRVTFAGNNSPDIDGGAAAVNDCIFAGCTFSGNSAVSGAAVAGNANTFISCAFRANVSFGTLGAVHGNFNNFINCTFRDNRADAQQGGSGAGGVTGSSHTIANCIFWENCSPAGSCTTQATQFSGSVVACRYTTVQGWTGSIPGPSNNGTNPMFADAAGRLSSSSPVIDSGNNFALSGPFFDADFRFRFADGPAPNTGLGPTPQIDRGAFEYGAQPYCYANINQSTALPILNVADFTSFLQLYAAGHPLANCDDSTSLPVLNVADFTCFLQRYVVGCG